jgi:hypothetical protein
MALYNMASDLLTRQTVWVGTNVVAGKGQENSHTRADFTVDGLSAADVAGMSAHAFRNDVRAMQWG